ncbi:PREDICTED: N-acetyltransferase 8-like [Nanorana parkeri]|uniref:N-acetyltransferase 8-like n=1 Tax=Nanorana parkeri TaxID=125878 RepID=UPI000855022D|nr:PREDICTED: N-acetyltransferase 8-like [Nanorana parkeri]
MPRFIIRPYQDSDYDVARNLFACGIEEHSGEAFRHALRLPHIWLPLSFLFLFPALHLVSVTTSILAMTLAVAGLWFGARNLHTSYVRFSLSDDLMDIRKYYMERDGYSFWVAESGGELVGTVAALPSSQPGGEKHLEVKRLSVSRNHRGEGIGKALCRTVIDFAQKRGCEAVVLTTTEPQINACKMYEKMGFRHMQTFIPPAFKYKLLDFKVLAYQYDLPNHR